MKTLTDIIYQYKDKEFNWENLDCCVFSVSVIEEFTGKKWPEWKKEILNYNSSKGAKKFLKKLKCKELHEAPTKVTGAEKRDIATVKLGDLVYYINEDGQGIMGVCNGKRAYFLQYDGGITARNIEDCIYCWSID